MSRAVAEERSKTRTRAKNKGQGQKSKTGNGLIASLIQYTLRITMQDAPRYKPAAIRFFSRKHLQVSNNPLA
ncbi:hypothetical protein L2214_22060 [Xanthomonas perforans]|uniref:Uncharacterized protein n=1 Tax=Xanthomonas perforans TaxID=442694 RepID=A0A7X5SA90_XANPE|nr:hypothetical protein [Xanthomonas perforans]MBZ2428135.1 hypothetical protein [Xanthomonas perforans]MBZ2445876.1 hypothetical protein [Xanthomonas perforans]MBZ2457369.1 hypothetical protein [Xanthomonas perforans]MBZ2466534.1 hypothetical protein [Xanthomonas perforans]MBZ2470838.1 hypothetical protein [Xanthomonas perforans]